MERIILSRKLRDIGFPVFAISNTAKISVEDTITYITSEKLGTTVLDDLRERDARLGSRRLKLSARGVELYPLRGSLPDLTAIVKHYMSKNIHTYIDLYGNIFKLKPSTFYNILNPKIIKRQKLQNKTGYLVKLQNIPKALYIPELEFNDNYVELIFYQHGYMVIGTSETQGKRQRVKL